jgi:hypothetical protein
MSEYHPGTHEATVHKNTSVRCSENAPYLYFPRVGADDPEEPDDEWNSWNIEREEFNEKAEEQSREETAANDESFGVDEDEK